MITVNMGVVTIHPRQFVQHLLEAEANIYTHQGRGGGGGGGGGRRRRIGGRRESRQMPCVYISTNVCLDGLDLDPVFADATKAVAAIIGRPENFVMVILKGSLAISFGGNKEPAAYTEIVAMGGINTQVKRKLIATLGDILHKRLSILPTRFFLKVYDTTAQATPKL